MLKLDRFIPVAIAVSLSLTSICHVDAWASPAHLLHLKIPCFQSQTTSFTTRPDTKIYALGLDKTKEENSLEDTTEAYGLEAGLFESMKKDDGGASAKSLLAKYGVAYLATSIPLAIVSFAICFFLVDNGVDVAGLLNKVGIQSGNTEEKVGTFAIAYAAHKAASPIRFPPTVLLTPVVAKLIGKEPNSDEVEVSEQS
jgi:hypothetical protein